MAKKLIFNPLLESGFQFLTNEKPLVDDLNLIKNEQTTQVYFEEIAAGSTSGQITFTSGISIQEGFLGKDGDILVSGLNADGFPNEETPTDNSGVELTASFTNVANGSWTLDTGTDNPPNYTLIFAVTGSREDVINWKNSNPQYELWFDATESVVDLTLQGVYDNTPSPKSISLDENLFFGLNGNKIFVSGFEFSDTANVSRKVFIVNPQGNSILDLRNKNSDKTFEFISDTSDAKIEIKNGNNTVFTQNFDQSGNSFWLGYGTNQLFGFFPSGDTFLRGQLINRQTSDNTLDLVRTTGQSTNLLNIDNETGGDLIHIDSEGRLNLLTDIGVPDTNDDGSIVITGGISATHTTSDNHTAYFLGNPNNKPVFKARHQTLATSTGNGKLFMGGYESDGFDRFAFYSSGAMGFGGGSSTRDVFIWRELPNQFDIADNAWSPTDGGASIKVYGEGLFQKSLTVDRLSGQTDNLATFNSEFGSTLVQITSSGDINSLSGNVAGQNLASFLGAQFGLEPNSNGTARDVVSTLRMQFGDEYSSYNSPFSNLGQSGRNARAAFFEENGGNNNTAGIVAYSESNGNNGIKSGGYFQGRRTDDFDGSNLRLIGSWGAIDNLENQSGLFATGVLGSDTNAGLLSGGSGGSYGGYFIANQTLRTTTNNVGLYATAADSGSGTFYAAQFDGDVEVLDETTGVIMTTPDGTSRYRIQIDNSGNLTTTAI